MQKGKRTELWDNNKSYRRKRLEIVMVKIFLKLMTNIKPQIQET